MVNNRSDFVVLFDAKDCNPNGDPLSATNEPRIDDYTNQGEVSPGRMKRYIRDQMFDEGEQIFVRKPDQYSDDDETEDIKDIPAIWDDIEEEVAESKGIDLSDDDVSIQDCFKEFMEYLTDVRFFGNVFADATPDAVKGPVQVQVGRTFHQVQKNRGVSKITGSFSTGDGSGGAMGNDERIHYGFFGVNGAVNENAAENTGFSEDDVEYLDEVVWRSLVSQTHSNTKSGQKPRGYLRVEYNTEHFQIGNLTEFIDLDISVSDETEIRSVSDFDVDVTDLVSVLDENADHIKNIHLHTDYSTTFTVDGEQSSLGDALDNTAYEINTVEPY